MRVSPFALAAVAALAASAAQAHGLTVALNHSARLPLTGPAQSVIVGSPGVIDVAVVDSHTIYVSGKTAGETDVTVLDPIGRVVFHGDVTVNFKSSSSGGSMPVNVYRGSTHVLAVCGVACLEVPLERAADATAAPGAQAPAAPTTIAGSMAKPLFGPAQSAAAAGTPLSR